MIDIESRTALDLPRSWPTKETDPVAGFQALDVDRVPGYAVVLALFEGSPPEIGSLHQRVFRELDGDWCCMGGCGGGGDDSLTARYERRWTDRFLYLNGGGRFPLGDRPAICHVAILCAPKVAGVVIDRGSDPRVVDVSRGPGWFSVVWREGFEPTAHALGTDALEVETLTSGDFAGFLRRPDDMSDA